MYSRDGNEQDPLDAKLNLLENKEKNLEHQIALLTIKLQRILTGFKALARETNQLAVTFIQNYYKLHSLPQSEQESTIKALSNIVYESPKYSKNDFSRLLESTKQYQKELGKLEAEMKQIQKEKAEIASLIQLRAQPNDLDSKPSLFKREIPKDLQISTSWATQLTEEALKKAELWEKEWQEENQKTSVRP